MFSGDLGAAAGNPPPVILLNGYGDYVFKNIPVVVKSFSIELPQDVNYIATTVGKTSTTSGISGPVSGPQSNWTVGKTSAVLAGVAGAFGSARVAAVLGGVALASGAMSALQNAKNSGGIVNDPFAGGSLGRASHVPVKSAITVQLMPIYSRESMRKFNLADFVGGKYVGNNVGYI